MKKFILLFCVIVSTYANYIFSQSNKKNLKPDFTLIKEAISNKASKYYYPVLLNRFINNDTSLTDEQYRLLYFGYIFNDLYDPYWISSYSAVLKKYYKKSDTNLNDCDSIIKYCKLSIADFPFDLEKIGIIGFIYHKKGDFANERLWDDKYVRLWNTIRSTGSGIDEDNPIYVITLNHEYELYSSMSNFQFLRQFQTSDSCDYIEFIMDNSLSRLYFDSKIMMKMSYKSKLKKQKAIEILDANYNQPVLKSN